jgi:[acyl-carrier-protein] S-malonyltransferase
MKTMLVFAGQGSQYLGMGIDLLEQYPTCVKLIDDASNILGINMNDVFKKEESFRQTFETQLMMVITQAMMVAILKDKHITFDGVMGFSLGEMTALYAAGIYDYETLIKLTASRAKAMQTACEHTDGMMAAVVKLDAQKIESICHMTYEEDSFMVPVNYNSPQQTVISGHKTAFDKVSQGLKEAGGRVIPLKVAGAFHTQLMDVDLKSYETLLKQTAFECSHKDIISNVTGSLVHDQFETLMYQQVISPVQFTKMIKTSQQLKYTHYIEIGPGDVLTGLIQRQLSEISMQTLKDAKTLEDLK